MAPDTSGGNITDAAAAQLAGGPDAGLPLAGMNFEELLEKHAAHRQLAVEYLPLLYGGSEALHTLELKGTGLTDPATLSLCDALQCNTVVHTVDLRDNFIGVDGCRALASMLEANKSIESLLLGGNRITDEGVVALLGALEANKTLKTLDVSGSPQLTPSLAETLTVTVLLNSRPAELKAALKSIRNGDLQLIDLSFDCESQFRDFQHSPESKLDCWAAQRLAEALVGCNTVHTLRLCNQQIGDKGAAAMAEMLLRNQRIDTLDLFSNNITNAGVEALLESLEINNCITVINVKGNCVSDEMAYELEHQLVLNRQPLYLKKYLPKLARNDPDVVILHLDEHVSCRYYDDVSAKLLSQVLRDNTNLTALDLSNNNITAIGTRFLSDALKVNRGIRTLSFSNNSIGGEGASYLAAALRANNTIASLQLNNTGIDDIGGKALAAAAAETTALTKLDLSDNPGVSESGAHFVRAVQHTNLLKELNLTGTHVSKITLRALKDCRAVASEPPALRSIVAKLHRGDASFTTVDLRGQANEFALKDSSASVLGAILQESYVLTDLDLSDNLITKKGAKHLCDGLLVNRYTLRRLSLRNNNGLDYEVAKMLTDVLTYHNALTSLDLSNNHLLDAGGKVFFEFLKNVTPASLTELDVSGNKMEPELERGIQTLVEGHRCLPKIKPFLVSLIMGKVPPGKLDLKNIQNIADPDIHEDVFNNAARALAIAVGDSSEFTSLDFQGNRLGDKGLQELVKLFKRNKSLVALDVGNNRLTDAGVQEIIKMTDDRPEVRSICVDGNKYVSQAMHEKLQYTLRFNNQPESLKHLLRDISRNDPDYRTVDCSSSMSGSQVTNVQLQYLCEVLMKNDYIEKVLLGHNHITLAGAHCLVETLKQCPRVNTVSLRNNVLEGSGVAKAFADFLVDPRSANLTDLDLAYNQLDGTAVEHLLGALEGNTTLMHLDFRGNAASESAVSELQRAVSLNAELEIKKTLPLVKVDDPSVASLDLSGKSTSDATVFTTCEAMRGNTHVTTLNLSHNRLVTDASCVNYLAALLRAPGAPLRVLNLSYTSITSVGACHLLACLHVNTQLQVLDLSGTDLSPGSAVEAAAEAAFGANTSLLQLGLQGTGIPPDTVTRIQGRNMNGQPLLRKALLVLRDQADATLTELDLSGSLTHNDTTCYLLGGALQYNNTLTSLDLSQGTAITDTGIGYLAHCLRQNIALRSLSLRSCSVQNPGAAELASALHVNRTLAAIDLAYNKIGNEGCESLISALRLDIYGNNTVTSLDLQGNAGVREDLVTELTIQLLLNNGPGGLKSDIDAVRRGALQTVEHHDKRFTDKYVALLVDAIMNSESVTSVDLAGCGVDVEGGDILAELVASNRTIRYLNLSGNSIGGSAAALVRALHTNDTIRELDIASNGCNQYEEDQLAQFVYLNHFPRQLKKVVIASLKRDPTQVMVDVSSPSPPQPSAGGAEPATPLSDTPPAPVFQGPPSSAGGVGRPRLQQNPRRSTVEDELNLNCPLRDTGAAGPCDGESGWSSGVTRSASKQDTPPLGERGEEEEKEGGCQTKEDVMLGLNDDGVGLLSEILKTDAYAENIALARNSITGAGVASLAAMLRINCSVRSLDVSCNLIGDDGVESLAPILSNHKSLSHIDLSGNLITEAGGLLLLECLETNSNLKELHVGGNTVTPDTLKKIRLLQALNHKDKAFCSLLQKVVLGNPHVTSICMEGWLALGYYDGVSLHLVTEAIAMNPHVEVLDLSFCDVGDDQVPLLVGMLRESPHLKTLKLPNNLIKRNMVPLATVLADNTTLTSLDLRDNGIGLAGAKAIADMLRTNQHLSELDVSGNELTQQGVTLITEAVKMNNALQHLWAEAPVKLEEGVPADADFNNTGNTTLSTGEASADESAETAVTTAAHPLGAQAAADKGKDVPWENADNIEPADAANTASGVPGRALRHPAQHGQHHPQQPLVF